MTHPCCGVGGPLQPHAAAWAAPACMCSCAHSSEHDDRQDPTNDAWLGWCTLPASSQRPSQQTNEAPACLRHEWHTAPHALPTTCHPAPCRRPHRWVDLPGSGRRLPRCRRGRCHPPPRRGCGPPRWSTAWTPSAPPQGRRPLQGVEHARGDGQGGAWAWAQRTTACAVRSRASIPTPRRPNHFMHPATARWTCRATQNHSPWSPGMRLAQMTTTG